MGLRILVCVAVLLLSGCGKRESGCATPATQASLLAFVDSEVRQKLRLGEFDPIDSGLLKISKIEGFEATRLDEERERSSCRAIIQFDVEGRMMPTPIEYDLLPSGGDDDSDYDTVVNIELPLGGIWTRLNNGAVKRLRDKEHEVSNLEELVERIDKVVAAGKAMDDPVPFAAQSIYDLDKRSEELSKAKEDAARMRDSLLAGRGGR